jgi:hypothetical protein
MKSALLFFAGGLVGALVSWFVLSKDVILVPNGTTLVEVDRFNGNAREVFYSYADANKQRWEEEEKVSKSQEAWDKAHQSPNLAVSENTPVEVRKEAPELTAEDLALVKFTAKVTTDRNPTGLEFSIYNGTGKTLVLAQARVEGTNKESGLPLARNVEIPLTVGPSTDAYGAVTIQNGYIDPNKVEGLKVTLAKALAK